MTDPDMNQPPNGADGEPQLSSTETGAEPDTGDAAEDVANPVGDVAKTEGEPDGPGEPEDFADHSPDQIASDLGKLKRLDDSLSRQAWIYRMQTFPRVRALKDKCGGTKFEAICKRELKLNKTYAHQIISRLYREPHIMQELWNKVIADSHIASERGEDYIYPATKTMLNWYKPPDEDEGSDTDTPEDSTGDNDPRTKGQIIKDWFRLKSEVETLVRDLVREKAARTELTRDFAIVSQQATERGNHLTLLRERVIREQQEYKAEIAARDRMEAEQRRDAEAALAAAHAEIERLQSLIPVNDNGDGDGPDNDGPGGGDDGPDGGDDSPDGGGGADVIRGMGGGFDENGEPIAFRPFPLDENGEPIAFRPFPPEPEPLEQQAVDMALRIDALLDHRLPTDTGRIGAAVAGMEQLCALPDFAASDTVQWIREIIRTDERRTKQLFEYDTIRRVLDEAVRMRDEQQSAPEPPQAKRRTLAQSTRTRIDSRWGVKQRLRGGGPYTHDERDTLNNKRLAAFDLLHDEPDEIAQVMLATLKARTALSFWDATQWEMDLPAILGLKLEKE